MAEQSRWSVGRVPATGTTGMVAAKTPQAASEAATVLARTGNALDAAVVAAFVSWIAEPWMSGPGGGGYLVIHEPDGTDAVVEFPIVAPAGATTSMFPLASGHSASMFGWPNVVGDTNIVGPLAVGVPGAVAGLALALERFGTLTLAQALAPAIALCEQGVPVTWHWSMEVARDEALLTRDPEAAALFLDGSGRAPWAPFGSRVAPIARNPSLAGALRRIGDEGPDAFYRGPIATAIVDRLRAGGSSMTGADLADYRAVVAKPMRLRYRGHDVILPAGPTGGATVAETLALLQGFDLPDSARGTAATLHLIAEASRIAFADRYRWLADPGHVEVPFEGLVSDTYLDARRAGIRVDQRSSGRAGTAEALGVSPAAGSSASWAGPSGSTTHISTMDGSGRAVSLSQTLVSLWGSGVLVPGHGMLLNNGMMWFDPRPGQPGSVAGGKRPLSNMAPAVVLHDGHAVAAIGATGGRRIMDCVTQLILDVVDHGMTVAQAVNLPRVDHSTEEFVVSDRFGPKVFAALVVLGESPVAVDQDAFEDQFASPVATGRRSDGTFDAGVDAWYPPATAIGLGQPEP